MELTELQEMIEKLAKGINYYTGEVAGDDEIVNDVKISRALFEVNDILKSLIVEKNNKPPKKRRVKYVYDAELMQKVKIENRPICLSQVIRNVITAYNGECLLRYKDIVPLLMGKGLLIENPDEKNPKLIASAEGAKYGITAHRISGRSGDRWQTVYDENGQKFVLDILKELR